MNTAQDWELDSPEVDFYSDFKDVDAKKSEAPPEWATESVPDEDDPVMYVPEGMSPEDVNRNIFVKKEAESSELKEYLKKYCDEGNEIKVCPPTDEFGVEDERNIPFPDINMGLAGTFAKIYENHIEAPKHFMSMVFLTYLGAILPIAEDGEIETQPRLYTLLLAQSAQDRKSTVLSKVERFFRTWVPGINVFGGVNSAEGLGQLLKEKSKLILSLDEMSSFLKKCSIDGSVLSEMTCSLFENNQYYSRTKKEIIEITDAQLSIVGATTIAQYEKTWGDSARDLGLLNRTFLVPGTSDKSIPCPTRVNPAHVESIGLNLKELLAWIDNARGGQPLYVGMDKDAEELYCKWYDKNRARTHEISKRLDGYSKRIAMILAVTAANKLSIDAATMKDVIKLMEWQLKVRELHQPLDPGGEVSRMVDRVKKQLANGPMTDSRLQNRLRITGDLSIYLKAMANMEKARVIERDKKDKWQLSV